MEQINTTEFEVKSKVDFEKELKEKLPELKAKEGFPIGEDKDILSLSEPPFYTTCPNPFLNDFIEKNSTPYQEENDTYKREAYLGDISESKEDTLYNLHTYHTKVPPKAIMKKILHYTNPGDIVLDGFAGTGMTGLAAFLCGYSSTVNEVTNKTHLKGIAKSGIRKAILNELSPIAAFICKNYGQGTNAAEFNKHATRILAEVQDECGWMFQCNHKNDVATIDYTVYSDVFVCPFCSSDVVFWEVGVDVEKERNKSEFFCNSCNAELTNLTLGRKFIDFVDDKVYKLADIKPVMIAYTYKGKKYKKDVDETDIALIKKIDALNIPYWYPKNELPEGYNTAQPKKSHGLIRVDFFYSRRNLYATAAIYDRILKSPESVKHSLLFWLMSIMLGQTKMNRYFEASYSQVNRYLKGTLYVGKKISEVNFIYSLRGKLAKISKNLVYENKENCYVSTGSVTELLIPNNSIDYIFTDPPFGGNIMYSELNFIWESWLKIFTNIKEEAIVNKTQKKELNEYTVLMEKAFKEYYRVLKPKRWITVEFHNSRSDIWNSIQSSLLKAGFIVSSVSILDKVQETFKQMTSSNAVKSDLAISAFKPSRDFEERFLKQGGNNLELDFIEQFLSMQPTQPVLERTDKMLYSKMLAYYIQHGYEIRYDAKSFYPLLNKNFAQEDGFWFTSGQINSYIEYKKRMKLEGMSEVKSGAMMLFVTDEKSAIIWLYTFLNEPKTFAEAHTAFTQLTNIQGDEVPELREIMEENFINENGSYRRPMNEPEHNLITEKREKALQREFESLIVIAQSEKGKIKSVRKEAVAYGFENCYKTKRFQDILTVAKKMDKSILENSSELNDFVDAAEIMVQGIS